MEDEVKETPEMEIVETASVEEPTVETETSSSEAPVAEAEGSAEQAV